MRPYDTSAETTSSWQNDKHAGDDGTISMNVKALETDLFERSVQVRRCDI